MVAYHGTVVGGLQTLKPYLTPGSNLKYPAVYLSTNKALSSIYIWNKQYKWMTFEIRDDGMPIYNESFKDCLPEFYSGVKGYIYTCEANFEIDEKIAIKHAVVSKEPVSVTDVDIVDDAYKQILQYEKDGMLIINRYESLSDERKIKDRNMVLSAIKGLDLLKGDHPLSSFVSAKFPELWDEALHNSGYQKGT